MSFLQSLPLIHTPSLFPIPKLPSFVPKKFHNVLTFSSPKSIPSTNQEILEVVNSDDKTRPCVRSYENDLCRLDLSGAVDFEQALTAAAADGGVAAAEHIDAGMPAMVVKTLFPGSSGEHSTVSTRLFLPARKVQEKAKRLRSYTTEDMFSGSTSRNILAMTFRQVVLQQLWDFDLIMFTPGTERYMKDLENPREVHASFKLSSSDPKVISVLSEVVCLSSLENTKNYFFKNSFGSSKNLFGWFHKPRRISSKDSSIIIYELIEEEMVHNAKSMLENYRSVKANFIKSIGERPKFSWWTSSAFSELERIGGPEFSFWAREYVPAYRLLIDTRKLYNVKLEGWKKSAEHVWEVLLTHSQMVDLANILDMYYEDKHTIPDKQLSSGPVANFTHLSKNKRIPLTKIITICLVSGIFLVAISILSQFSGPYLYKGRKNTGNHYSAPSSAIDYMLRQSLEANELEAFCISIVKKVKDALGWSGDITVDTTIGAWTGELPIYLRGIMEVNKIREDNIVSSALYESSNAADITASAEDIASFEVVLSLDGKIVGFQPTSQVAVNNWASNPLAIELYGGKKLSPGFLEPGLKIQHPNQVVTIELLMSSKPEACFALARPTQ